mmetsp:Transcript_19360/g.28448  ORF Transcript_19360/g.28448 Transcript_19360/m.28448 type:complete len:233 (-) Transcript_19360:245-943(-)
MKFVSSNIVLAQAIMALILNTKVSSASVRRVQDENKDEHYSRGRELQGTTKSIKKNVAPTATVAKSFKKNMAPTATVAKSFKKNVAPTATVGKTPKKNGAPTMPKSGKKLFGGRGKKSKVQAPTGSPSLAPSISNDPINMPSGSPSSAPSISNDPINMPSVSPSSAPSVSEKPSMNPSVSAKPSMIPSGKPVIGAGIAPVTQRIFIQTGSNDKKSPAGIPDDFIDSGSNDTR